MRRWCQKVSGSFFEKKEPKKLFSLWLWFGAGLGSLRPEGVFGERLEGSK
jgi:hypothetical protein